jgi:1-acyl-sn-glycerol-3-phosphate acyltransferase
MLYGVVAFLLRPTAWWGRLRVEGLDQVPAEGPLLVVPNHDSQRDSVLIGSRSSRRRPVSASARSTSRAGSSQALRHQAPVRA